MGNKFAAVNYHERLAEGWDERYEHGSFKRRANFFNKRLLPLVLKKGRWLDAGCGSGYFSRLLAESDTTVVGLDASENMISMANKIAEKLEIKSRVSFETVENIEQIPFGQSTFDGCICLSVLEYLNDANACLVDIVRVLKPNGYLILSVPHRRSVVRMAQKILHAYRGAVAKSSLQYLATSNYMTTPAELERVLRSHGLVVIKCAGFDPIVPAILHRALPPSLVYVVARKGGANSD